MSRSLFAILILLAAVLAPRAAAQGGDWGDWGDYGGDWDDWGDWGDFDAIADNREDPSDFDSDVDTDFEPDEILALNISRAALAKARALGFRVQERRFLRTLKFTLARLRPPSNMNARTALARLREIDPDGFYDRNLLYQLAGRATAPCTGLRCYGQKLIGWGAGCGIKTRVGIVDSALDLLNPALAGRKIVHSRVHGGNPAGGESEHGTAVAALLVGAPDSSFPGMLPESELVAADVFSRDRKGNLFTDAARLAIGLDWVASHTPVVINISITGPDGAVLRTAVRRLLNAGIALVAAAGNLGPQAPPQYPAAYPGVVAVTAIDRDLQVYAKANRGPYVSFAAPGVGIWTSGSNGAGIFREGTSFAAPFATASLALLKMREPRLTPASMLGRLKTSARDLGDPGNDPTFGWGLVQSRKCD
jgi:hypothetical protein